MAVTQNTYTGNGSTVLYSFTFPYLETTDIKVSVNGTVTTAYTLANATTIQFNTAPANGAAIRIYRETDDSALSATFYPGSAIRSNDLNDNFTQNLYVTQESSNNAATATTTANTALTNSNTAISTANTALSTANTASTNASSAVATANTASTNASAAVSTANTASSNATAAVNTANAASATATSAATDAATALSTANTALSTANTASTNASTAITTANAASTSAATAISTANSAASDAASAVSTSNTASSNASSAVTTANTASTNASAAVTTANSAAVDAANAISTANAATTTANNASTNANAALTAANAASADASNAVTTANSAVTTANNAVTTANGAVTTANSATSTANTALSTANAAASAVANAILYDTVANVAAIPASPVNNDAVEVVDSTGIQSFTPLSGVPAGFTGSSGLSVRMVYTTSGNTWNWIQYFPNDPESRYLKLSGGTLTGQLKADDSTSAAAPVYSFDGDTNTGLAHTGVDELALVTGGVARLTVDSTGSVNIPNLAPGIIDTGYVNIINDAVFYDADGSNYIGFKAPTTVPSNVTFKLPSGDGSAGQFLSTDGSGALSWTSVDLSAKLDSATAASTYAPLASPTFTGTVTIPAGASISGYLTSATAASIYQTQADMSSYLTSSTASSIYLGTYTTTTTATSKTLSNRERCSVTAAGLTITLPASPSAGWEVSITVAGSFTDTVVNRNGSNLMSLAENMTIDKADMTVTFYYVDATRGWRVI